MTNFMQRLEAAWMRRHVGTPPPAPFPDSDSRKPVCIVTGGSEGIGRHLAAEFARGGHALLLVARTVETLEQAAAELRREHSGEVYTASVDLTAPDAVERVARVLDAHGLYADYLVNNAGIGIGGEFAGQEPQRLASLVALNVAALTALTRYFLPDMLRRAHGGVLNIASLGGLLPGPYQAAYYASKAYVISLTEALAYENAGRGVRIAVAAPGPVRTRFHERMGVNEAYYLHLPSVLTAERAARAIYSAFMCGRRVIVPGVGPSFNAFAVRVIPHFILVPFIGWLLKQRY